MEFNPKIQLAFYQPNLKIVYTENDNPNIPPINNSSKEFYNLYYIIEGSFKITEKQKHYSAEKGAVIISKPNESFGICRTTPVGKILKIDFQASAFRNIDFEFLRVFNNLNSGFCFYPASFENLVCYETLNSFLQILKENRGTFYMIIKLLNVIAELDFQYDKISKKQTYDTTNTTLSVIEFVKNNYNQDITLETLREKFFISNSTINRMFKAMTGKTFKVYINDLRLENIKDMLEDEFYNYSISKIAEIGGYKTYSTFYREYIKKYGIPPTKNLKSNNHVVWPIV